jgi:U3 small nucleolar RNA-associated protein 15
MPFYPESLIVTAGGPHLCCWDLLGGGRLLHRWAAHQKTVTKVLVRQLPDDSSTISGLRVISASLDGHVKVFDPQTFELKHASKYPSPILSLGLTSNCTAMAVGMADGTLSLRARRAAKHQAGHTLATGAGRQRWVAAIRCFVVDFWIDAVINLDLCSLLSMHSWCL